MEIAQVLADIYGFDGEPKVETLRGPGINNQVMEVRSGGAAYVLKQYQTHSREETILYEHRLLAWLNTQPLPFRVPVPHPARTGATLWWHEGRAHALFALLEGEAVWPPSLSQLEQIGAALARLHGALADYPMQPRPGLYGHGALDRIHPVLPNPAAVDAAMLGLGDSGPLVDDLGWWRDEVGRVARFVEAHYAALPHQVIHGDFVPSNTLFVGDQLTAVLDFDLALPDARVMDIASGLGSAMRVEDQPQPWDQAEAFCRGYGSVQRLTPAEVAALPDLMALRDVVATIWWLGRSLAAGDVTGEVGRIGKTRQRQAWRVDHGAALVDRCACWLA